MSAIRAIENQRVVLDMILKAIPEEHRGILFERLFECYHPQKNTCQLERSFALLWAERNSEREGYLLHRILHDLAFIGTTGKVPNSSQKPLPKTKREWQVAYLTAATLIQWLPTSVGCAFLREAFEKGGGEFSYKLPDVD